MWGPGKHDGNPSIVIGLRKETLERFFESVEVVAVYRGPYAMPWRNNMPIHLCRGIKRPLAEIWPELKHYE